jgi:probable F420-dependent oxidoreductase
MRYSVALPHPTRNDEFVDPDVLATLACAIEDAGFDACAVMDHPFPLLQDPRAGGQAFDMFTLGGFLASATKTLTIHLNLIVMGYRNPFVTARSISTLDHLARGRVLVGIGAGYMEAEFDALGAEFARRGPVLDEGVLAMKAAWTGEPITMDGSDWKARGNSMLPTPYSDPHPPLFRGGNTRKAIESAVRHFQGWNPFEAPRSLAKEAKTASIASQAELESRLAYLRETQERFERQEPIQVSLDRPDPAWMEGGRDRIQDEVGRMEELGIDWIVTYMPGASTEEMLENIRDLADAVSVAPAA